VPIADPGAGKGGVGGGEARDGERRDVGKAGVGRKVDGAISAVLIDEVDGVFVGGGAGQGCERGGCEKEGVDELHLDIGVWFPWIGCEMKERNGSVRSSWSI